MGLLTCWVRVGLLTCEVRVGGVWLHVQTLVHINIGTSVRSYNANLFSILLVINLVNKYKSM